MDKTLAEYQLLLDSHDWQYNYSDDHSVYCKGLENNAMLIQLYQYNDLKNKTNDYWNAYNKLYSKYHPT